jgi:hypothetical protein
MAKNKLSVDWVSESCGIRKQTLYKILEGMPTSKSVILLLSFTLHTDIDDIIIKQ